MKRIKNLIVFPFTFLLLLTFTFTAVYFYGDSLRADASDGWTDITSSGDTRIVYVSSSEGDDSNDGLSPSTPVKTLNKAASMMRDGYPDHMLLKRGDVWTEETLGRFKSGRSADEPMVISYYGTSGPRPKIKVSSNFIDTNGHEKNHLWIIGLHVTCYVMDPSDPD